MDGGQLLVGAVGIDVDDWRGVFYDADMPDDWRIAYYSTLLRSAMLPVQEWRKAVTERWVAEVDADFRFVLQLPGIANTQPNLLALARELAGLPADFAAQVAGVVLPVTAEDDITAWHAGLDALQALFPLCLDAGSFAVSGSALASRCRDRGLALAWYPAIAAQPESVGDFLVAYLHGEDLPGQRAIIEQLDQWMGGTRRAGLFHALTREAPLHAQETRQLAELMGF